jgi:adenylate kinase
MSPIIEREGPKFPEPELVHNVTKNAFIIIGPPTSGKSTQGIFIAETIKAQIIRGGEISPELSAKFAPTRNIIPDDIFIPALKKHLFATDSPKIVLENIPRTIPQAETVMDWAKANHINIHAIKLDLSEDEVVNRAAERLICPQCGESFHPLLKPPQKSDVCDHDGTNLNHRRGDDPHTIRKGFRDHEQIDEQLVTSLKSRGAILYRFSATGTVFETSRRLFGQLSLLIFDKPETADGYFRLRETLAKTGSKHLVFSPDRYYGNQTPVKTFANILVPENQIDDLATNLHLSPDTKNSSVALTRFVDIAPGVEINSDLKVKTPDGTIEFPFDFLWPESIQTRIMGLSIPLMGLEDTILLKAALGRFGPDDWGKHKDDISDIEGLFGAQSVNFSKLVSRAESLRMLPRLREILTRIDIKI